MVTFLLILALVVGFYMAWNIGANDVANAVGTSVGSGALSLRQAVLLAAVFEFGGAFFAGDQVAQTMTGGIVPESIFAGDVRVYGLGMVATLLAAAVCLNIATFLSKPISTTHAIIGALIGFALVRGHAADVEWSNLGHIGLSWIVSPLAGGLLGWAMFLLMHRFLIGPHNEARHHRFVHRTRVTIAVGLGAVVTILAMAVIAGELGRLNIVIPTWVEWLFAFWIGFALAVLTYILMGAYLHAKPLHWQDYHQALEIWFGRLQVVAAAYMCFAHGANDVANAVGPLAGAFQALGGSACVAVVVQIPSWILALGGGGIVVGLATYGFKVIRAVGHQITEITPTRGFAAQFATATTVLACSRMGLPISTTFVLVGAVMGIGLARGKGAIDLKLIGKIVASWIITLPVAAVLSALFTLLLLQLA